MTASSYVIGIDIGGTNIKAGIFSETSGLLEIQRRPTPAQAAPEFIIQEILGIVSTLCQKLAISTGQLKGLGISIAAFISAHGKVTATAHLSPKWIGYDLNARLFPELGIPCYYALDVVAPALGEAYYGAGKGIDHFVYVTVSTGIGAGIIAEGRYFTGGLGWAGGVGHTILDENSNRICEGCGNAGCLETFAAKQGILASARELLSQYPNSLMIDLTRGNTASLTPKIVYEAAQQGDPAACRVFSIAGHALGIALTNLVDIVAPRRVVIGGGIAQAGDLLLEPAREILRARAFPPLLRQTEIVQAGLTDLSGIYGAAAMVYHNLRIIFPNKGE